MKIRQKRRATYLSIGAAVIAIIAATLLQADPGPDKVGLHAQMGVLATEIAAIRIQLAADPGRADLAAELAAKLEQYGNISRSMGGDEPANVAPASSFEAKDASLAELTDLDALVGSLRVQLAADPTNQALIDQLDQALADFDALSLELGGDQPPAQGGSPNFVAAPSPAGCTATTTTSTNSTPTPIPDLATTTSTITVVGAGPYLWDLDLSTSITHTFAADLDITLTSPAGTVVTISTDNGGGFDNVFNGTLFDDQANPAGQVPYTANNGLVTDQTYANLVTATPLVPEEAFGAFIGENPNGTWTLSITDDLGADTGNLASWSLAVTTLPAPPTESTASFSNNTAVAIPTGPAVVASALAVAGAGSTITKLVLTTNITHTFSSDLDITLQSPSGAVVTLTTDNGGGNDNNFNGTVWDDDGGTANPPGPVTDNVFANLVVETPLVVEESLAAFNGLDPNGTWTVTISDDLGGDGGNLAGWTLAVTTGSCATGGPCTCTPVTFTQATPVAIPTGPAVVSSTLAVAGAPSSLYDLDLTTFITHTFNSDLDITLQSPAGTVVTITTDNGGGNDNVYNGTLWNDKANPAGQVPYTANNGLVTDQTYVNLVTATPLVIEEALAAFNGENPNGIWTLTISDDLGGDGGSLASWSLAVCALIAAPTETTTTFSNVTPVAIPTGPAVVSSTLAVAGAGSQLGRLRVTTGITHTFNADLDVTLASPTGTVVTLTTDNGGGNDNVFNGTLWDDKANPGGQVPYTTNAGLVTDQTYVNLTTASPLVPEEAFGAFIDENPNGTWTVTISDDLGGDGGSLGNWSLEVTTVTCGGGGCTPGSCDDDNPCTDDVCNTSTGQCVFTPDNTNTCTDDNACTADACDAGECVGTEIDCDDDQCCTIDSCDTATGCVYAPNTSAPTITTQPSLSGGSGCAFLWPPQHGYVDFDAADTGLVAQHACGIATVEFASCSSSQPENENGVGDGNSERDCVHDGDELHLRGERNGACSPLGRVYTSALVVTNACGISTSSNPVSACVWHNRSDGPPAGSTVFSANPGSNQNDTRPGTNGSYGADCGPGCGATCSSASAADIDMSNMDRDADGVPIPIDNCPDVANAAQQNTDDLAEGDACDANDGLVDNLRFLTGIDLNWAAESGAALYDLYRGEFQAGSTFANAVCLMQVSSLRTTDIEPPIFGHGYFYMLTSVVGGSEGSLGQGSNGTERTTSGICP